MPQTPSVVWDPAQYLRYREQRTRPLHDLLARVPDPGHEPGRRPRVIDIGCGPGNSTELLRRRWPDARVTGLDVSPEMIEAARPLAGPNPGGTGATDFARADATTWDPAPERPDVLVSNATLHWIPGHLDLATGWLDALRPGGTLAFQVPGNFGAPSHTLLAELRTGPRWNARLGRGARRDASVHEPREYLDRLAGCGCAVDVWETTYHLVLPGEEAVLDWVKGSALRPVLGALQDPAEREEFVTEYRGLLRQAYPRGPHGTVFPFRRIFVVARRP